MEFHSDKNELCTSKYVASYCLLVGLRFIQGCPNYAYATTPQRGYPVQTSTKAQN